MAQLAAILAMAGCSPSPKEARASEAECRRLVSAWLDDRTDAMPSIDGTKPEDFAAAIAVATQRKLQRYPGLLKCLDQGCAKRQADNCLTLSFVEGALGHRDRALEVGRKACRLRHSDAECQRAEATNTENMRQAHESLDSAKAGLAEMDRRVASEEQQCRAGDCAMCDDVGGFHAGSSDPENKLKARGLFKTGCDHGCTTSCDKLKNMK